MTKSPIKRTLNRSRMIAWLDSLEADRDTDGITICLRPDISSGELGKHLVHIPAQTDTVEQIASLAGNTVAGTVIIWTEKHGYLVHPPFPLGTTGLAPGIDTRILRELLQHDYLIGLVLVRLGAYAVGVVKGEKLLSSKVGTGNVHGRHRQGGSSAHRFERHRDKQIEYFITRLCHHAREHLEPHLRSMDYLVYGGARTTIETVKNQCHFLKKIKTPDLPPLLDIPDPRQYVLEKVITRIWSSTVYEWIPGEETG